MEKEDDIKYCVTAYIDLLGFSNHLEISSNDLRTNIGKEAIKRLQVLEDVLTKLDKEKANADTKDFFPSSIYSKRINDALIFTMDLPNSLMPSIGSVYKGGFTPDEFIDFIGGTEKLESETIYEEKVYEYTIELMKFVGLVSRIHGYINSCESKSFFPGAKTVISSGFRKVFKNRDGTEDFLTANFSFSNAYKAEPSLHGAGLYVDCYIFQLVSNHIYSRNLIKASVFIAETKPSDPFIDIDDYLMLYWERMESIPKTINLFRKTYLFRELDDTRCAYLQLVPELVKFMLKFPAHQNKTVIKKIFNYIVAENVTRDQAKRLFAFNTDLDQNIKSSLNYVLYGTLEAK